MNCSGGVCAPTATDAVLNVGDLETLLASGNVTVTTTGSGVEANDIRVEAAVVWDAGSALALEAFRSLVIHRPISVEALAGLILTTNNGGTGGALSFDGEGRVAFSNPSSSLTINDVAYQLVSDLKTLAYDIVRKPHGSYALADKYDAGADGVYSNSPVSNIFYGSFSGLGNNITNLSISDETAADNVGLFAHLGNTGAVADLRLSHVVVRDTSEGTLGGLVGVSDGTISNTYVEGRIQAFNQRDAGMIAGYNDGAISRSHSAGHVSENGSGESGGLVGVNYGSIMDSWSDAFVGAWGGYEDAEQAGGLVGDNTGVLQEDFATGQVEAGHGARCGGLSGDNYDGGSVVNSYATGNARGGHVSKSSYTYVGGLIGFNYNGSESTSYSTGVAHGRSGAFVGGFFGADEGSANSSYWDTTTSGTKKGAGDGNESGITGLTTTQLQSGLPQGFDPNVWAQHPKINNGLPYLISNPPPK
ncbi:MAG TPA: hypothetical protein VGL35_03095 [Rhizomicrobium sp.]|jgi:hypothetical protein